MAYGVLPATPSMGFGVENDVDLARQKSSPSDGLGRTMKPRSTSKMDIKAVYSTIALKVP